MWPGGTHSILLPESSCVCILSFKQVLQIFSGKSTIFGILLNTESGVVLLTYLNHSHGDTDYKYIWVCGSTFNPKI